MSSEIKKGIWFSNVLQFMPHLSIQELQTAYSLWSESRMQYAKIYERYTLSEVMATQSPQGAISKVTRGILISFHFSAYRLLPRFLLAWGHHITLLASAKVLEREMECYAREIKDAGLNEGVFAGIDASRATALREIICAVEQGRLVLVFIDADEGAASKQERRSKVELFDGLLSWRSNIFKLAGRFKIPLFTGYVESCYLTRTADLPAVRIIEVDDQDCHDAGFAEVSKVFVGIMDSDWVLWENWCLLHRYVRCSADEASISLGCPILAMPLLIKGRKYFLDMSNGQFFSIE